MKLSIFIVTKDRHDLLSRLLFGLTKKVNDPENIEIIFGLDHDDVDSENLLMTEFSGSDIEYKIFKCKPKDSTWCDTHQCYHDPVFSKHEDFLQPMCEMATGDLFWVLNDDLEIGSDDYDQVIIDTFKEQLDVFAKENPSKIAMGGCREIRKWRAGSKTEAVYFYYYPIITRETYETMGWFLPPTGSADHYIWHIFKSSNACKRVVDVPIFLIDHVAENKKTSDKKGLQEGSQHYRFDKSVFMRDINKINQKIPDFPLSDLYARTEIGFRCHKCGTHNPVVDFFFNTLSTFLTCQFCHVPVHIDSKIVPMLQRQDLWNAGLADMISQLSNVPVPNNPIPSNTPITDLDTSSIPFTPANS
jgi:hypothetical protein